MRAYKARIMVDDAHATGILGKKGRGTAEHFGLEDEVDIIMGTCSKSLGAVGGFVAGSAEVIHYVKHRARPMIFSASLPAACVATIGAAIDVIQEEPERRERLWEIARTMKRQFTELGFDTGQSETPIIPVILGDDRVTFEFAKRLRQNGIFANAAVSPAVPKGRGLIRTSYMATHTDAQLERVLKTFAKVARQMGI